MDPRNLDVKAFYEKFGFESFEGGKVNELGLKFLKAKVRLAFLEKFFKSTLTWLILRHSLPEPVFIVLALA